MLTRLFNRKPYRGGPDFERISSHCFDLNGTSLEFTVPATSAVMKEPPRMLNFPFQNAGWFDAHCKRSNVREYISVFFETWPYFPKGAERIVRILAMGSNDEMANISIAAHLNRTEKGRLLALNDPHSLSAYISWEYEDYYESPDQGSYGKGKNYVIREEYRRQFLQGHHAEDPFRKQQYEAALADELEPLPREFNKVNFGGEQWTHFTLKKHRNHSEFYCLPLAESYYLEIKIGYRFEAESLKVQDILATDMQRTADWLLQHVKVTKSNAADPLVLPYS